MGSVVVAGMTPALAERVRPLLEEAGLDAVEVPLALVGANASALPLAGALASAQGAAATSVVLLSSAIVHGAWPDNPVPLADDPALRPNPGFSPAVVLAEAERVVADWGASHPGVAMAFLRPAAIWLRNRKPSSMEAGIEEFNRELRALAPETRSTAGRPGAGRGDRSG